MDGMIRGIQIARELGKPFIGNRVASSKPVNGKRFFH
jgi:hypothetical protein